MNLHFLDSEAARVLFLPGSPAYSQHGKGMTASNNFIWSLLLSCMYVPKANRLGSHDGCPDSLKLSLHIAPFLQTPLLRVLQKILAPEPSILSIVLTVCCHIAVCKMALCHCWLANFSTLWNHVCVTELLEHSMFFLEYLLLSPAIVMNLFLLGCKIPIWCMSIRYPVW